MERMKQEMGVVEMCNLQRVYETVAAAAATGLWRREACGPGESKSETQTQSGQRSIWRVEKRRRLVTGLNDH